VVEGKGHRIDSGEILIVEEVLLARQPAALATKIGGQSPNDRIKDRDCWHLDTPATFLQRLAKHIADQSEQDDTLVCVDAGDHSIDLTTRPDHAPDMLDRLRPIELHKAGPRHGMNGLSGGIRNEMEVKTRHQNTTKPPELSPRRCASYDEGKGKTR
jgi:hypothetical protein